MIDTEELRAERDLIANELRRLESANKDVLEQMVFLQNALMAIDNVIAYCEEGYK